MPKRTLGFETLRARAGHNRKKKYSDLSDIDGMDLLHVFHGWVSDLEPMVDEAKGRYLRVIDVHASGRTVVVEAESGYFGEPGNTVNVKTHSVEHERGVDQSATTPTRLAFVVPPGGTTGLFCAERHGNQVSGSRIIDAFRSALLPAFPTFSFDTETVFESEAWNVGVNLLSVTAVAYGVPVDLGNGVNIKGKPLGKLQQTLEPERGAQFLPSAVLKALRDGTVKAADFIGFEGRDVDDTFVTVSKNGRQKTYNIEQEKVPAIRVLLNTETEKPLTLTPFTRRCQSEARDFYEGMKLTWNESWNTGKWTKDQLAVSMPDPPAAAE